MQISGSGLTTWLAPASDRREMVNVIISVSDTLNTERLHAFDIYLRNTHPADETP